MRSRTSLLIVLFVISFVALPIAVHAANTIPFFGPIIPEEQASCAASWGLVIVVINNIILLLLTLAIVFVAPLMIAWAGFLFVVNPVNASGKEQAKKILKNTVVGIVIALASWLIIDALMAVLYNPGAKEGQTTLGRWSDIITSGGVAPCIPLETSLRPATTPSVTAGTGTPPAGVASCAIPPTGSCSVAAMNQTCFASRAEQASRICQFESGGVATIESGSDRLNGGSGPSYSIGLWQLNLTTTPGLTADGQACTSAFTGQCAGTMLVGPSAPGACHVTIKPGNCGSVTCQQLYLDCKTAATNPTKNTNLACQLYGSGTFQPWTYTANRCGIPLR